MYYRNFFFLFFIMCSALFFFSFYNPNLTLYLCGSTCENPLSLNYIQLTSMIASCITFILFVITYYYTLKRTRLEKERIENDRQNIENIHAELEALKN